MKIEEIANLNTTLEIDPDEARILAAACRIASFHAEGSDPATDLLAEFGDSGLIGMLLDGYGAMFEAASMAGAAHFALRKKDADLLSLSGIRTHGTGARIMLRKDNESEEANVSQD